MVGLVRSTRYVLALASPAPPAPLPRSGFVQRHKVRQTARREAARQQSASNSPNSRPERISYMRQLAIGGRPSSDRKKPIILS